MAKVLRNAHSMLNANIDYCYREEEIVDEEEPEGEDINSDDVNFLF